MLTLDLDSMEVVEDEQELIKCWRCRHSVLSRVGTVYCKAHKCMFDQTEWKSCNYYKDIRVGGVLNREEEK